MFFVLLSLVLWGTPNLAMALSEGAEFLIGRSGTIATESHSKPFNKGEVITITFSNPIGSTGSFVQFGPPGAGYNNSQNTFPSVHTITVPSTGVHTISFAALPIPTGRATIAVSVAPPAPAAEESALSNTIASASRGQTSTIVGNIMSRTANFSSGTLAQEGRGRDIASSLNRNTLYQREEQPEARDVSLRDLAQFATFNTAHTMASAADTSVSGIEQRRGIATGEPLTLWGHASFTSADNDFNKNGDDRRYDGDVWGYSLGADYRFHDKVIAGLSVGYTDTDMTTTYNAGKYEEQSWNFSPYVMYEPVDGALISLIAGYSFGDVDRKRVNSTVTGKTDSGLWYTALEGEYRMQPSDSIPLELTARLGYLLSRKTLDAFTESDGTRVDKASVDTSQIKPGVEVAYSFNAQGTILQPFAKVDYIHDFVDEINNDSNALNLGGGLRVMSGETGLSGVIEGERQFARDHYSEFTIKGLLAYNFALNGDDGNQLGILAPYVKSNLDADGGQVFGSGLKFTSDDNSLSCGLEATHAMSSENAGNTGAEMMLELAY